MLTLIKDRHGSRKVVSKIPSGGVAIFDIITCRLQINMVYNGLRDCVICHIKNSDIIIAAVYIPPSNSKYFDNIYFTNLEIIYNKFKSCQLMIMGDINCQICTPNYNCKWNYSENPDQSINTNGKTLLNSLRNKDDIRIVNGLCVKNTLSHPKFTFYKGNLRSQYDFVLSNASEIIDSFRIMNKTIYCDHCPIFTACFVNLISPLNLVKECSAGIFNDDHWDINK